MTSIERLFEAWLAQYGPQEWWPAEDGAFEIMVGAVLVQRTSWGNAARAIERLRAVGLLDEFRLAKIAADELQSLIEPAGFFRVKARRLRSLAGFVAAAGGVDRLERFATAGLRDRLLSIHGVGAETADAMLLYAFERPVVVVDAYLRRILERMHGAAPASDDEIRREVLASLDDTARLNELHALAVAHAKGSCRSAPSCDDCCVRTFCRTGLECELSSATATSR